ncbi:nuclear transport factor 2 family protein [Gordonia sp. DT30]|uniref:nuclear transport factor 2 family protein n=1 Tax=unclassified Gordonia (in: high G+C Gram-positive bacteria) TaxID=2657482 RepID=UPI003CEDC36D
MSNSSHAQDLSAAQGRFSAHELTDAFATFQQTVAEVGVSRDWDRYAELFTTDADYIEHALGTMHGREEIRSWIWRTMTAFPGSHMTGFPALWHVVDASTARVISEVDNPMRDPGDGSLITATNITILTYAGDGLWSCEEDVYNPLEFGTAAMRWCEKAADLGTLDDSAAQWMHRIGPAFAARR